MAGESNGGRWLQDVIKYLIGGLVAAGLVTFIGFLTWRGSADAKLDAITARLAAIEQQRLGGIEKRIETIEQLGSVPVRVLEKEQNEQDRRLEHLEKEFDVRGDVLNQIIRNQAEILSNISKEHPQWKLKHEKLLEENGGSS